MHTFQQDSINKMRFKYSNNKKIISIMVLLLVLIMSSCSAPPLDTINLETNKMVMYKSPNCGCCVQYAPYIEGKGFDIETVSTDTSIIKQQYNIPGNMQSCHTIVVGDYFVEGHVPIEAINKLLEERPEIDGISLPGMPAGSPGMPGYKQGPFQIYAIIDGVATEYMTI